VNLYFRLLGYLRPYRVRMAFAIFCMVVYSFTATIQIKLVEPFTSLMFSRPAATAAATGSPVSGMPLPAIPIAAPKGLASFQAWWHHWLFDAPRLVAFERLCMVILGLFLFKNVADYIGSFLSVTVEQAAMRDVRRDLFHHLQSLSLSFYHSRRTGGLISQMTNDVEALRSALAAGISNLLKDGLTLIGALTLVFLASWRLALMSMLILPPAALVLVTIGRKMRKRSGRAQERMADMTGILQESIAGVRVVKAFHMEAFEERRYEEANTGYFHAFVHLRRVSAAAKPFSEYAIILVAVAIAWLGAREIFDQHSLPPERFFTFVTALLLTISPIKSLSEVNSTIATGLGAADRVFGLLDTPATITDVPDAPRLGALSHAIEFDHVKFAYETGDTVLHDVSFTVPRGHVVALVGASGAGKSTTLDLLARFHDPTGGAVRWDGGDIRGVSVASLRAQLGIVTQETILFHDTVRANIAYGVHDTPQAQVEAAARAAHAHDFIAKLSNGYDTVIGDRGVRLSGGERQRLAIARALLRNPPVLLLDEATSALDTESERLVQDALERLMKDRTVLVIAHRLSTVQHANAILVFDGGRIVQQGTHDELVAEAGGAYRRLHDLQFRD
jgi:subfamily B ATP-binding cassette protein MsbA